MHILSSPSSLKHELSCYIKVNELGNPIPNDQFLDSSKLKKFTDDNFKVDIIGRESSKQLENTGGKGEIAGTEQFLLFPQCFQNIYSADM